MVCKYGGEANRHWHQYIPELPPPYLHTVSRSKTLQWAGLGLKLLWRYHLSPSPLRLNFTVHLPTSPPLPFRTWTSLLSALRPQSILTFLSLPGQPLVGVSFCGTESRLVEKLLKTFCFWTFILTTRKRIIISDKVSGWLQFLDLTDGSISWWTILCVVFVLSWSWLMFK